MKKNAKLEVTINDEKRVVKCKEFLEYVFTEPELKEMSGNLARTTQEKVNLENDKKAITSEFTAKIAGKNAEIVSLANKVNNCREHRYVDCTIQMNTPEVGKKTMKRLDTGEEVWIKNMSSEESQLQLNLDGVKVENAMVEHSSDDDNNK